MTVFLFLIARKVLFLTSSLGLGVAGFLVAQHLDHTEGSKRHIVATESQLPRTTKVFDAEPKLLARAESPVDLGGDAMGVTYILQKDGDILRVSPELGGNSETTRYASLGRPQTEKSVGFSAIAIHPHFHMRGLPGYGKFYVVVAEKRGSGVADFATEFGDKGEHHQDVVYEYSVDSPLSTEFQGRKREVMRFSQPGPSNNLQSLAFDHTGALYLAVGDGAVEEIGRRSASRNASSLTSAFGKVLRIDPTTDDAANGKYGIPKSNPFRLVSDALPKL